jgi:hypothetical protein
MDRVKVTRTSIFRRESGNTTKNNLEKGRKK